MANSYYLVTTAQVDEARACAPTEGAAYDLFQVRWNNNETEAIVQAAWEAEPPGQFLGLYVDGHAEAAVYAELAKPEWQVV